MPRFFFCNCRINSASSVAKYNPFHRPAGPGGGQFTDGPSGSGAIKPVEWRLNVDHNSTFVPDPDHPEFTFVHALVMTIVQEAILEVTTPSFKPGSPGYGQRIHDVVADDINTLDHPGLYANPVYIGGGPFEGMEIPGGSVVPDIVYVSPGVPPIVFEIKTGRATNTADKDVADQRDRTPSQYAFWHTLRIYSDLRWELADGRCFTEPPGVSRCIPQDQFHESYPRPSNRGLRHTTLRLPRRHRLFLAYSALLRTERANCAHYLSWF